MNNILILGANSDIAKALAHCYAKDGDTLMLAARQAEERLSSFCTDLKIRYESTAIPVEFDAFDMENHQAFYDGLPHSPSVVISVFGYLGDQEKGQNDVTEARKIIDANFTGVVSILNVVANDFEKKKSGTIIGISSVAGDRGRQSNYLYGSAKAGLTAYLSGLRNRLYPVGVHVMTVTPGFVQTSMTEALELPPLLTAQPETVAEHIKKSAIKGKNRIYTPWFWRYIMLIIRAIPEQVFKRLKL